MPRTSPDFDAEIARVKTATNLSAVIGTTLDITPKGLEFVACCPFHAEKTPSFKINDAKGFYHCFGCGAHGDVFDWLEQKHGMAIRDAVAHLGGEIGDVAPARETELEWQPIVPPPADAPRPHLGSFDHVYTYADADGAPLFYIRRRDASGDRRKVFTPLSFGVLGGKRGWHPKHPAAPRALYGLDRLASRSEAAVIVCEGEKAADAAQRMFPGHACVSWCAGTANVDKADWSPLTDRSVIVWPDNDGPGVKAAAEIVRLVPGTRVLRVDDLPAKADAADVTLEDPGAWLTERLAETERKKKANGHDLGPPPIERHGRPIIRVYNGLRHVAADAGLAAMVAAGVDFYQRDKTLVRVALTLAKTSDGTVVEVPGIIPVTHPILARALGTVAEWQKLKKDGDPMRIDPPGDVVDQIAAMFGHWPFAPIAGVIGTPTMRPDGSILCTPGYDDATGLVLVAPPPMAPIPARPDEAQAHAAMDIILDLLAEFPFADSASRSVAVSMVLTTVLRGALLPAVPMHASTAPQPGTGKSYLLDIASAIATGERCAVIAVAPDDPKETEKRLIAAALAGHQIIALDNCSDVLSGDFLNQVTERPLLQLRALGGSDLVRVSNNFTVFANGNNLQAPADLVRRTLVCRLDANLENPEDRQFVRNPFRMILANRGRYIAAALTVGRAFVVSNAPRCKPLPSFEPWSDLVRSAIVWLGLDDPCDSMELARAEDLERAARAALFEAWRSEIGLNPGGHLTSELVQSAEDVDERGFLRPRFRDACLVVAAERSGTTISSRRLGKYLMKHNKNRVGDVKLSVNRNDPTRPRWVLGRV